MSHVEPVPALPYAQPMYSGVDPQVIYRIIGVMAACAAVGRLIVPLQTLTYGLRTNVASINFAFAGASMLLGIVQLLLTVLSAVVGMCVAIGALSGHRTAARWLWTSEPAGVLASVLTYGTFLIFNTQRNGYTAFYMFLYPAMLIGSLALPVGLLMLLRAAQAAEKRRENNA